MPDPWSRCQVCGEREAVATVVWPDGDARLALVPAARRMRSGRWLADACRECAGRLRKEGKPVTMIPIAFVVPIAPVPKARARIVRDKRGNSHTYTPESTQAAENDIGAYFRAAYPGHKPWPRGVALAVDVLAVLPQPATGPGRKRRWPTVVPDIDNLEKLAWDALKGLAWEDDCQIVESRARKRYGDPRWEIRVWEVME